jgi:peptide/nickel transport system permease protein
VKTVGGIVFPGSPLAATHDELIKLPGLSPDIEKSRAEARALLKEAGAEGLSFEMLNRNVDQPYTIVGTWLVDEFRKIGVNVTQKIVPTGPWLESMRAGDFAVALEANCQDVVNPIADTGRYLPHELYSENFAYHDDPKQVEIYNQMVRETDPAKVRVLMREYEKQILEVGAHQLPVTWWYRILPMRSYVKGWKISSSHYLNQNLANIWLDKYMYQYILKRVLLTIPTLIGAAALVFLLMRLIPGDICLVRLGGGGSSFDPRALANCHAEIGIDRPFIVQFLEFIWGAIRLDFGTSMWSGKPVITEIAARLPVSLEIAVLATVVAVSIAIPLGTISALKQNSWLDVAVRVFAIGGIATPSFWIGIVSILLVLDISSAITGSPWMPPIDYVPFWKNPIANLSMVALPAITVGYRYAAVSMRMTRSAMLEVMKEDYIRTARAKGLINKLIINRHALKNALLPIVTLIGIEFAFLIGGLVVTEQVFNLNGVGRLFVQAVQNQDYTLTQALVMLTVTVFVITNLAVDLLYAWLDPRIRFN